MLSASPAPVRGNENNDHQGLPGGLYYGGGKVGGYTVFNLNRLPDHQAMACVCPDRRRSSDAGTHRRHAGDLQCQRRTDGQAANGTFNGRRTNTVGETFVAPGATYRLGRGALGI